MFVARLALLITVPVLSFLCVCSTPVVQAMAPTIFMRGSIVAFRSGNASRVASKPFPIASHPTATALLPGPMFVVSGSLDQTFRIAGTSPVESAV